MRPPFLLCKLPFDFLFLSHNCRPNDELNIGRKLRRSIVSVSSNDCWRDFNPFAKHKFAGKKKRLPMWWHHANEMFFCSRLSCVLIRFNIAESISNPATFRHCSAKAERRAYGILIISLCLYKFFVSSTSCIAFPFHFGLRQRHRHDGCKLVAKWTEPES